MRPIAGQVTGIISLVAFNFIVHEPSGIMLVVSEKVFGLQAIDIAEHFMLSVVGIEDGGPERKRFEAGVDARMAFQSRA